MDVLDICQLLSILFAVTYVCRRHSRGAALTLACVVLVNATLTGFTMKMSAEGVTWHQVLTRQVDGNTMSVLVVSGFMYAAILAMFIGFAALQVGKFLAATLKN